MRIFKCLKLGKAKLYDARSLLFSANRYATRVSCRPSEALRHYEQEGWKRGENPHVLFDTKFFVERYSGKKDIDGTFSPFRLYDRVRKSERPVTSPFFQPEWYLRKNIDVAAAGVDPLLHYVKYGAREGRQANPWYSFYGFDLEPSEYFNEFDSLDDWIERASIKKVITKEWITSILHADATVAHSEFWRRRMGLDECTAWPVNPEVLLGGMPHLDIPNYKSVLEELIARRSTTGG